jgi:hypothetical protein
MAKFKVRIWKTILQDYYAELSNGLYGSNLAGLNINPKTRKITSIDGNTYMNVDKAFIEDATMIAETIVNVKTIPDEYPWHEHERVAWAAVEKLFKKGVIPKKMPRLPQPTSEIEYY